MSRESAMSLAAPVTPEVNISPVTGIVPENVAEAANPSVENGGAIPQPMVSTQMSHLAKKEAKLLAEREAFKKEQEEFQSIKTRAQEFYDKAKAFEEGRAKDPIKALRDLGFTEKEIVDYLSQEEAPKPSTEEIVQAELKKFKDEEAKKVTDAQKAKDEQLVTQFKSQLSAVVAANPEKFELCAHYGSIAEEIMFGVALEEAKDGKTPDAQSIAEDVEEYYLNQYKAMGSLKKLTPKQEVAQITPPPERSRVVHPRQDIVKPKATTLTNKIAATSAAVAAQKRHETYQEKRARIEAAIKEHGLTR